MKVMRANIERPEYEDFVKSYITNELGLAWKVLTENDGMGLNSWDFIFVTWK